MAKHHHFLQFHISKKQKLNFLDKTAVVLAFLYPLTGIPQLLTVIQDGTEGVSILSWLGFAMFSAFFLTYATVHKIKPMMITYTLWLLVDSLVVILLLIK